MLMPCDIELYWRVRNNPFTRDGLTFEEAIVYADEIRHELEKLDTRSQFILQAKAAGFNQKEMADMLGVSLRTMVRWHAQFEQQRRYDA